MKRINKIFAAASLAVVSALTVAPTVANAADANSANTGSVKCSDNALFIAPPTGGTATFMPTDIPQGAGTSQIGFKIKAETDAHVENISYNTSYFLQNLSYSEAVKTGVDAATRQISKYHQACPNAKIHLTGYSEGANVMADVVYNIAHKNSPISKDSLGAATLIANPVRANDTLQGGSDKSGGGLFGSIDYGDAKNKVIEVCNTGDIVCDRSNMAPNFYNKGIQEIMSNTALLKAQIPMDAVISQINPDTIIKGLSESIPATQGWNIHGSSYMDGLNHATTHNQVAEIIKYNFKK